MGIRASLSFRYIAPTTRTAKSSILTPKIAKIPFAETGWARDRIAPNCTIRHPVRPIVALQRRMRFSARLAGFYRDRCHQRRARRAERASFSVFVSNPDFRVPRLRQREERALTGGRAAAEKRPPERPRIETGAIRGVAG